MKNLCKQFIIFVIIINVNLKIVKSESTKVFDRTTLTTRNDVSETSTIQNLKDKKSFSSLYSKSEITTSSPESSKISAFTTPELIIKTVTENGVKPWTVLEYKPITSFYHPHPVTLAQLIPPGKPWPDSPPKSTKQPTPTTFPPNLVNRFPELTTLNKRPTTATTKKPKKTPSTTENYVKPQTVLEYVPTTSFYHPNPVTPAQIVPPGKPWPASPQEQQTKPSSSTKPSSQTSTIVNLNERFPDLSTTTFEQTKVTITDKPNTDTTHLPTKDEEIETTTLAHTSSTSSSTHILLTYKPQRPWYHPRPGDTVNQIIPPGKPWPASPEGYTTFSVTTLSPWLKRLKDNEEEGEDISLSHSKVDNLQEIKIDLSLEPNALQYEYYPERRTAAASRYTTPANLFTSGTRIANIGEILEETHNVAPPKPSHLLPYDVDNQRAPSVQGANPTRRQRYRQRYS